MDLLSKLNKIKYYVQTKERNEKRVIQEEIIQI